jgi:hypothetical protein
MFEKMEGDRALLVQGGVFKQADLYQFAGALFARAAGGFVRLYANGSTSRPGMPFTYLETAAPLYRDQFGRLTLTDGAGCIPVTLRVEGDKTVLTAGPFALGQQVS